ncbi:hypothetical protein M406DRAFT_104393 [Cryphonectria parasitica EP155]|uniref:Uncharacterized protein n=1 Tax=Cryphonectria parasitica (strain ATCC 38755 / EP155) TaxID=660469 RepID=A0A9P4XVX1_CRYP1|nr:uncharacterized protein M406DRAFT_104393 [Cryphonectria parasitica EP155]KAF3761983.1 hypothetical protein M406DRAFT_104393 [Cryphonectria parasitica EP155]
MGLAWWKQLRTVLGALLAGWSVLLCGPMSMSLHTVGANALRLRRFLRQRTWRRRSDGLHFDVLIPFMQTAVRLYRFRTGTRSYSYRFMLTAFQDLNCKDPQDMWPALGIIHHMPLALDTDTNAKIVSRYIHTKQDLLPLVRTTEYGRGAPLPSWVPDWEAGVGSQLHFYNELSFIMSWELFNASSGRSLLVEMWPNSMLRLLGVIVDEVRTTYSVMEPRIDEPVIRVKTGPKRLEGNLKTLLAKGGNSEHVSNDFWRLLTCDIRPDEKDDLKWRRARSSDRVVCEREYRNGLLGHGVRGRRLFSAGQGDFGLGPANTMIGDVVAVLYGGRFPFILRRAPGRNTYTLVGYAYVQGIMDGEALSGAAETEEIFLI